jgi:MFS transporter, DHA1 family, inner membrane transport protein
LLMALAALIGLVWARGLPERPHPLTLDGKRRLRAPDSVAVWSFIEGLTLDGLFIFGLSLLAQSQLSGGAILVVGCLMAVRYLSEIAFSPLGGHLAERWGALPLLVGSSLLASFALLLFGLDWFVVGAGLVLLLRAVQLPLVATIVAARYPQQRIQALASNAVWRDMGAGLGPLLAGWLVPMLPGAWRRGPGPGAQCAGLSEPGKNPEAALILRECSAIKRAPRGPFSWRGGDCPHLGIHFPCSRSMARQPMSRRQKTPCHLTRSASW